MALPSNEFHQRSHTIAPSIFTRIPYEPESIQNGSPIWRQRLSLPAHRPNPRTETEPVLDVSRRHARVTLTANETPQRRHVSFELILSRFPYESERIETNNVFIPEAFPFLSQRTYPTSKVLSRLYPRLRNARVPLTLHEDLQQLEVPREIIATGIPGKSERVQPVHSFLRHSLPVAADRNHPVPKMKAVFLPVPRYARVTFSLNEPFKESHAALEAVLNRFPHESQRIQFRDLPLREALLSPS